MSTVDIEEAFVRMGDILSRGFDHAEADIDGRTVFAIREVDDQITPDFYEKGVYPSDARRREWDNGGWFYAVVTVIVMDGPDFGVWDLWEDGREEHVAARTSVGGVESDSPGDHYAELIGDLYAEAMSTVEVTA